MTAAFLATFLFALSVIFANRTTRMLGPTRANLYRLFVALGLLAVWGHVFGQGLRGGALAWFFLSGCIGFGAGDLALYQALPRVGPRLAGLLIQCLAAPFALVAEWVWLGIVPAPAQMLAGCVVLAGVALAVAPKEHVHVARRVFWVGVAFGVVAALGQGLGAVVSRKAYAVVAAGGGAVDGLTAAYQRMLGGVLFGVPASLWLLRREAGDGMPAGRENDGGEQRRVPRAWGWVLANALAGPTVGVGCYQWALSTTPSGVVLPIVATMPILVIPLAYLTEGDRPTLRSILGGLVAVGGVAALTLVKA